MKHIKRLIIFFVIIIIIIIGVLFYIISKQKVNENNNFNNTNTSNILNNDMGQQNTHDEGHGIPESENNRKLKYVQGRKEYFTVEALTNNYMNLIGYKNKSEIKNILSPQYMSQYKINDNNILNIATIPTLDNIKQYYKNTITQIITVQVDDNIYVYLIKGKGRVVGKSDTYTFNIMVELDESQLLYNIYPYQYIKDKGYDKLKVGDTFSNYTVESITNRENNEFNYITKTDLEMANEYFNNYSELLNYYKDDAYNKLNSEYSKRKFGSKENFETYLKDNSMAIALMSINQYKVNSYRDYTDYICTDKYNNVYIFRQQGGIMNYNVFLDDYTIMIDGEEEYYNKLEKVDKSKYNLNKLIKMINTKDYNGIYNSLDNTFRNNNFKTVDSLKKYLQTNLYNLNNLELEDYNDTDYAYYVFNCKITNIQNSNESKNMTIIINQSEGTDYTMSFSIK